VYHKFIPQPATLDDCVTFPLPLVTAFLASVDDTLTWGGGRAFERDSETSLAEEVVLDDL